MPGNVIEGFCRKSDHIINFDSKMAKRRKQTDSKAIEEKALNYLKTFIEDSTVISQYIPDNDKLPLWDGYLYLYSDGFRDKNHFYGKVAVQVKGIEVDQFPIDKWKFKLEKTDLNAYLKEPAFFIVCQIKKDSKERKLFYRELLPEQVKILLRDMGNKKSHKTIFYPLTENLHEFENQLKVFDRNSRKMSSFVDKTLPSLMENLSNGHRCFSFEAPVLFSSNTGMLSYLTTHDTYWYAKYDVGFDLDIPVSGGPFRLSFMNDVKINISVGNRIFYSHYKTEIENGIMSVIIGGIMRLQFRLKEGGGTLLSVEIIKNAEKIHDFIKELEFILAIQHNGFISIGIFRIPLKLTHPEVVDELRLDLERWKALQQVLDQMHVKKDLELNRILPSQSRSIDIVIDSVGKGKRFRIPDQKSDVLLVKIGNINLLLWCLVDQDGFCRFGDFFDGTVTLAYKMTENETIDVSPYTYLQKDGLWKRIDNIDFSRVITSAEEISKKHNQGFIMANYDVWAMLTAYDEIVSSSTQKAKDLLETATQLNRWLLENDIDASLYYVYWINKMQIVKRKRAFSEDEIFEMKKCLEAKDLSDDTKVAICLLLEQRDSFPFYFNNLSEERQKEFKTYPIWSFYDSMMKS